MVTLSDIEGLGTHWWFELFDCPNDQKEHIRKILCDEIIRFNDLYSRFKPDSFIYRLNQGEIIENPPAELLQLIKIAECWEQKSQQLFTLGSGAVLEQRGYDPTYSFSNTGSDAVTTYVLEHSAEQIRLTAGTIDFGGFGKGYLIDLLAKLLKEHNIKHFLINGGGDMYATSNYGEPIEVAIEHPTNPKLFIAKIPLCNTGLGVSSSYKRSWRDSKTNTEHNHLVDANAPEKSIAASSVVTASTALQADVCATLITIDPEQAAILANEYTDFCHIGAKTYMSENFKTYLL